MTSSGAEVPAAIIVIPTSAGEMPQRKAKLTAAFTRLSPPTNKIAKPTMSKPRADKYSIYSKYELCCRLSKAFRVAH